MRITFTILMNCFYTYLRPKYILWCPTFMLPLLLQCILVTKFYRSILSHCVISISTIRRIMYSVPKSQSRENKIESKVQLKEFFSSKFWFVSPWKMGTWRDYSNILSCVTCFGCRSSKCSCDFWNIYFSFVSKRMKDAEF